MSINACYLLIRASVTLIFPLLACAANDPNCETKNRQAKGFLWRVQSETATVYTLGVIHVANENLYPLPEAIQVAFDKAETLVLETKIDKDSQQELHRVLFTAGTYPPGETLEQHLSKEVRSLYHSYIERPYVDPNTLECFRPWIVAWLVSKSEVRRLGYSYDQAIAMHFFKQADTQKRILGLETPEEYATLFNSLPESAQEHLLRITLLNIDKMPETMKKMTAVWQEGDATAAEKLAAEFTGISGSEPLRKSLVLDRNKRMAKKVEQYLHTETTYFVIVGAGHLLGREGIIDILQQKGYDIQRL